MNSKAISRSFSSFSAHSISGGIFIFQEQTTMQKPRFGAMTLLASIGLLASVSAAHAQFFTYSTTYTDVSGSVNFPGSTTIMTTSANTFLNVFPGGTTTGFTAPTQIGLLTIQPISTDTAQKPITDTAFTLSTSLQRVSAPGGNTPIGSPGVFVVTGMLTGDLSSVQSNVKIVNVTGLPTSVSSGGQTFFLALDSIRDPGVGGSASNHNMDGGITIRVTSVPEPSTLALLAGAGISGSLFALRLRRRRK
jgi:hypothetical protein